MDTEKALVPVEQKQVTFYEDQIIAVLVETDDQQEVYVPLRPICDLLGVDWSAQRQRITRDPVLSLEATPCVVVTTTQGQPDQRREMLCLPLDFLNGWLFGVNATRVKDDVRERLLRYQRECYRVLHEAFQEGRLTTDPTFEALLQTDTDAVQAYKMALAVVKLARNQVMLEARLDSHERDLAEYGQRLEQIETTLGHEARHVTPEQASQISQAVKAVAIALGRQTKRNEFGAVYGELYRKFGITSYKQLPARRFQAAIDWLTEWHQTLVDDAPF
ncbi:MAG TPA: phage antirepressor N-terminal domain-containing protein [Anaerolineae bacterium]